MYEPSGTNCDEQRILSAIKQGPALPTIPAVAVEVLRMSHDPRVSIEKMAETIERDPALAAKTLRFANSSYYGASKPIIGLPQALVRIGTRGAKMLALSFSLLNACDKITAADLDYDAFWHRSLTTSVAARRIAVRSMRRHADLAFVGGLLADSGCVILAREFPREYRLIERAVEAGRTDRAVAERRVLGTDHMSVGRLLLDSWHMPSELCDAVGAHHDLTRLERDSDSFTVAALIMAASELADILIHGSSPGRIRRLAAAFGEYFSLGPRHIEVLLRGMAPEIRDIGQMLDVSVPPIEDLQEEAKAEMLKVVMAKIAEEQEQPQTP
jgi:HD-like signal output (HDOD) protein